MARRNIYQGKDSCYARKEKIYVAGSGVTPRNMPTFVKFIMRDYNRGWTYDHSCRKIRMTKTLAIKRLNYLITLCFRHYGNKGAERKECRYAFARHVIPHLQKLGAKIPNFYAVIIEEVQKVKSRKRK